MNHLYFYKNLSKLSTLVDNFVDNFLMERMILMAFEKDELIKKINKEQVKI